MRMGMALYSGGGGLDVEGAAGSTCLTTETCGGMAIDSSPSSPSENAEYNLRFSSGYVWKSSGLEMVTLARGS